MKHQKGIVFIAILLYTFGLMTTVIAVETVGKDQRDDLDCTVDKCLK